MISKSFNAGGQSLRRNGTGADGESDLFVCSGGPVMVADDAASMSMCFAGGCPQPSHLTPPPLTV